MKFTEFSLCRQGKFFWNRKHFGIDTNGSMQDAGPIRLSAAVDISGPQFLCAPQFCGAGLGALPAEVGLCEKKKRKK